jgi:hypothetical protein
LLNNDQNQPQWQKRRQTEQFFLFFAETMKDKLEIHAEAKIDFHGQIEYLARQHCSIETLHVFRDEMKAARVTFGQNPFTWPLARPSSGCAKTVRQKLFTI